MASDAILCVDEVSLKTGIAVLCDRDPDLARLVERHGHPPLWSRPPGFATLVHIILEQQVSMASAQATFERLRGAIALTPEAFLTLEDESLRGMGFSRQKTAYVRNLAEAIRSDRLDLDGLVTQPDDRVRETLCQLKGIGPWTAEIYLMMALDRADAWPLGDLAVQLSVQRIKGLEQRPDREMLMAIAEPWRPWRSVAARLLWQAYLAKETSSKLGVSASR